MEEPLGGEAWVPKQAGEGAVRAYQETSWNSFGSIIDLMSKSHAGTESRAPAENGPHLFPHFAQPSAHPSWSPQGPWVPGPTSSLCVLREDQEQDTVTVSATELRCHPDLIACPETGSSLETEVPSGRVYRELLLPRPCRI